MSGDINATKIAGGIFRLPGFWSGLKSSRRGVIVAFREVSNSLGSYVPGAARKTTFVQNSSASVYTYTYKTIRVHDPPLLVERAHLKLIESDYIRN